MKTNSTTTTDDEGSRPLKTAGGTTASRFLVRGRVQGVGFRWWTYNRARALGLSGSVRNLPDGRVEVIGSGAPADLSTLRADLAQGPHGASVEHIHEEEVTPPPGSEFRIEP